MDEAIEGETNLWSSDTEKDFGDENNLFYDEESQATKEVKSVLKCFDRDTGGFSNMYQVMILPKLINRSTQFLRWLIKSDLLLNPMACPNASNDPKCTQNMQMAFAPGLHDSYQYRCINCDSKESIRKHSIFYGVKCNLRTAIRILYGWVKGVEIELMENMLGVSTKVIGTLYNRAAKLALKCLLTCPGLAEFGGDNVVVLVDIYPNFLENTSKKLSKGCRPMLCITETQSMPQKYWIQPLDYWDNNDLESTKKIQEKIASVIFSLIKPHSLLVLPNESTISLASHMDQFLNRYCAVKSASEINKMASIERPLSSILDIIWWKHIGVCEMAQYFNPNFVCQFLVQNIWNEMTGKDSFIMLISFIVTETRKGRIESFY